MQLLQANVEGLQLFIVPIQWNDLEEAIVESQADHPAFGVNDANNASL